MPRVNKVLFLDYGLWHAQSINLLFHSPLVAYKIVIMLFNYLCVIKMFTVKMPLLSCSVCSSAAVFALFLEQKYSCGETLSVHKVQRVLSF